LRFYPDFENRLKTLYSVILRFRRTLYEKATLSFVSGEPCTKKWRDFSGVQGEPCTKKRRDFSGVQGEPCTKNGVMIEM